MAVRNLPITKTREQLSMLHAELSRDPELTIAVTNRGQPVLALLNWDLYESIVETLEILSDEDLMANLRRSIREIKEGKLIAFEEAAIEED